MIININDNKLNLLAKELKNKYNNGNNKVTINDLKILISCYVNEDYTLAHTTKLYNLYKNLYWYFLELLDELNINLNESDIMA